MENILQKALEVLPIILQALGGLVIAATAVVKLTPSKQDDINVSNITLKFLKFLSYLPTLGINPRTKALEDAIKDVKPN